MEIYYSSLVIMAYLFLTVNIAYSRNIDYSNNNITSRRANIYNQLNKQYPYLSHNEIIKLTLQKLQEERIITTSTTTAQPTKTIVFLKDVSYRTIMPSRVFNCPHCPRTFFRGNAYGNHLRVHVDHSWTTRKQLSEHPVTHEGPTIAPYFYKCRYCEVKCVRGSGYAAHLRNHEKQGIQADYSWIKRVGGCKVPNRDTSVLEDSYDIGRYDCPICSKNYWDGSGFASHLRGHERAGLKVDYSWVIRQDNPCWEPRKNRLYPITKKRKLPLTTTIKPMSPIKLYQCPFCTRLCRDGSGLSSHMRGHKGQSIDFSYKRIR